MNTTLIQVSKSFFYKKGIWIIITVAITIVVALAAATENWIYVGAVLAPFLIYISIKKPFIFPFGTYVFLLPFDSVLSVMGSEKGATLTKFLGILTILVLSLKGSFENKLKKPDKIVIWWILFVSYGIFSLTWAIDQTYTFSKIPTAVGLLVLYLIVSSYKIQEGEFNILKWFILTGGILAALFIIYSYETGFFYAATKRASLVLGERETNPNKATFTLLIPLSVCIGMMLKQKKNIMKGLFVIVIGVILLAFFVTGSRSSMLGVAVVFIVYILSLKQRITFGTISIVVGIAIISFIPDLYVFVAERWEKALVSGGAGRLGIWYVGLKALEKYWLIGAGLNNFPVAYNEFVNYALSFEGLYRAPHNTYLEYFVELGIIGFSFLILTIVKHYQALRLKFIKYDLDKVMLKAVFWAILIESFFGDKIWDKSFWLLWMMILMYKNISNKFYLENFYRQFGNFSNRS